MTANVQDDDEPRWERPDGNLISDAYQYLFASSLTRDRLRENAANGMVLPDKFLTAHGLVGRSLAWKTFLTPVPPLTSQLSTRPIPPLNEVRSARAAYVDALKTVMRAPDGNYEPDFILPGHSRPPTPAEKDKPREFERNNPLSLDEENPWKQWFENVELRRTIKQDVQRTFPDLTFFRDTQVQNDLSNILFLHAVHHPELGYRQGMHEVLATIFLAVDYDSLDKWTSPVHDPDTLEMCDRTWVAADAWSLFNDVMEAVNSWYEWREPQVTQLNPAEEGLRPYTAPIVTVCNRIQNQLLSTVDPTLWRRMSELGIEPQLYGIRWLRLLFTREFNVRQAMVLWDGIFAVDTTMHLAYWICVAMLVRIRNKLIPSDYSEQLSYLLRYPSSMTGDASIAVSLLLQQAIRLSQEPNTSTGASIVMQNRNVLGIPIEVPEAPPAANQRRRRNQPGSQSPPIGSNEKRESYLGGFPETFAKNIFDRSESLGINRAIANTVSELRRNITDNIPAAFNRVSTSSPYSDFPAYQTKEFYSETSPPWEPPPRPETNTELNALRAQQKTLARAMTWAVDAMMQDADKLDPQKRNALECLSYVRDVLSAGGVTRLDEDRLQRHDQNNPPPAPVPTPSRPVEKKKKAPRSTETKEQQPRLTPPAEAIPVMLSKRDSKPLTGLTRAPYTRREPNDPLSSSSYFPPSSSPTTSRSSPIPKPNNSTPPAPAPSFTRSTMHSPVSPSQTPGRQSQSALFGTRPSVELDAPPRQGTGSAMYVSSGYPPTRTTGPKRTADVLSPSTDPLGVLR